MCATEEGVLAAAERITQATGGIEALSPQARGLLATLRCDHGRLGAAFEAIEGVETDEPDMAAACDAIRDAVRPAR